MPYNTNMNKKPKGFSVVEIVAVIVIITILVSVALVVVRGGKERAISLRRQDAANALNIAEQTLVEYNIRALEQAKTTITVSTVDTAQRITALTQNGFLKTEIKPTDVQLAITDGVYRWTPAP